MSQWSLCLIIKTCVRPFVILHQKFSMPAYTWTSFLHWKRFYITETQVNLNLQYILKHLLSTEVANTSFITTRSYITTYIQTHKPQARRLLRVYFSFQAFNLLLFSCQCEAVLIKMKTFYEACPLVKILITVKKTKCIFVSIMFCKSRGRTAWQQNYHRAIHWWWLK